MWSSVEARYTKKPLTRVTKRAIELSNLIHTKLANFKSFKTKKDNRCYITFAIDQSRFTYLYLLETKDDFEDVLTKYKAQFENKYLENLKGVGLLREVSIGQTYLNNIMKHETHEILPTYTWTKWVSGNKRRTQKDMQC